MTARAPARCRTSRRRPRLGWCRWPAKKPRTWDTHTNCGPRGCWPVTPASTRPRPDIPPWPASSRARSARYSPLRRSGRIRSATISNVVTRPSRRRWAEVLCVYREVAILKQSDASGTEVAIISYDEKPGIQAIGNTAPDLPPRPGAHETFARDHEYRRHGTLSLLAGIDLLTGRVH